MPPDIVVEYILISHRKDSRWRQGEERLYALQNHVESRQRILSGGIAGVPVEILLSGQNFQGNTV